MELTIAFEPLHLFATVRTLLHYQDLAGLQHQFILSNERLLLQLLQPIIQYSVVLEPPHLTSLHLRSFNPLVFFEPQLIDNLNHLILSMWSLYHQVLEHQQLCLSNFQLLP